MRREPRTPRRFHTLRGVRALRASGFARSEPDSDPEIEAEVHAFTAGCLRDLAADLGPCRLKLFLNDDLSDELRFRHNEPRYRARLMPGLLPATSRVRSPLPTRASRTRR